MKDKRYLVFGKWDDESYTFALPLIESFDTEEEALVLFDKCVEKRYDWLTIYDRVEGIIIKEF